MTEKKSQAETKAPKAAAAKKASAAKPEAKSAVPAKAKAPKAASTGGKVTVQQVGSPIGRQEYQRATLVGLGLNKLNRQRTLEDTPSVRGMIERVKHLVKIVK